MTLRSSTNEREKKGVAKKSAASAKPARPAASSVRYSTTKQTKKPETKDEKKALRNAQRAKDDRNFMVSNYLMRSTQQYKYNRKVWWGLIILAILCTAVSFVSVSTGFGGQALSTATLIFAYIGIIGAVVIDLRIVRPLRNAAKAKTASMSKREFEETLTKAVSAENKSRREKKSTEKSADKKTEEK